MLRARCVLACALLAFVPAARGAGRAAAATPADGLGFLENILHFYGENASISTRDLEDLLLLISARRSDTVEVDNPLANQEASQSDTNQRSFVIFTFRNELVSLLITYGIPQCNFLVHNIVVMLLETLCGIICVSLIGQSE